MAHLRSLSNPLNSVSPSIVLLSFGPLLRLQVVLTHILLMVLLHAYLFDRLGMVLHGIVLLLTCLQLAIVQILNVDSQVLDVLYVIFAVIRLELLALL